MDSSGPACTLRVAFGNGGFLLEMVFDMAHRASSDDSASAKLSDQEVTEEVARRVVAGYSKHSKADFALAKLETMLGLFGSKRSALFLLERVHASFKLANEKKVIDSICKGTNVTPLSFQLTYDKYRGKLWPQPVFFNFCSIAPGCPQKSTRVTFLEMLQCANFAEIGYVMNRSYKDVYFKYDLIKLLHAWRDIQREQLQPAGLADEETELTLLFSKAS